MRNSTDQQAPRRANRYSNWLHPPTESDTRVRESSSTLICPAQLPTDQPIRVGDYPEQESSLTSQDPCIRTGKQSHLMQKQRTKFHRAGILTAQFTFQTITWLKAFVWFRSPWFCNNTHECEVRVSQVQLQSTQFPFQAEPLSWNLPHRVLDCKREFPQPYYVKSFPAKSWGPASR